MNGRLVSLLLLLAVTACSTPAPLPTPPPTPTTTGPCPDGGVVITALDSEAAMGLRVLSLQLRNCGTRPYEVNGYPDLELPAEDGQRLDVRVEHGSSGISRIESFERQPTSITLKPGDRATAGIVWRNTYDDTTNPPQVGAQLDVAPLAGRPRQTFTPRLEANGDPWREDNPAVTIDLGSTGRIGVSPWAELPQTPTSQPSAVTTTTPRPDQA